jgi:hypothetical protein
MAVAGRSSRDRSAGCVASARARRPPPAERRGGTLSAVPFLDPSSFPIADAAVTYLARRRRLLVRLGRVERALRSCDAWETNRLLPEDLQRPAAKPALPREILDAVQRLLTEELARLDGPSR